MIVKEGKSRDAVRQHLEGHGQFDFGIDAPAAGGIGSNPPIFVSGRQMLKNVLRH